MKYTCAPESLHTLAAAEAASSVDAAVSGPVTHDVDQRHVPSLLVNGLVLQGPQPGLCQLDGSRGNGLVATFHRLAQLLVACMHDHYVELKASDCVTMV